MNTWSRFPFVRFAFAAVAGILLFERFPHLWASPGRTILYPIIGFLICWYFVYFKKSFQLRIPAGLLALLSIAFGFGWITQSKIELDRPDHWRHVPGRIKAFEGRIYSDPLEKERTIRYSVELSQVITDSATWRVSGNIHLYVEKTDSTDKHQLSYGDRIMVLATPSQIAPPTNPEEFNYSAYVARQYILGQCFTQIQKVRITGHEPEHQILAVAYQIRKELTAQIQQYVRNEEAQAIALALIIGVKDYLDEDLKTAYASAGAMHVLAVSGLHVGILYMVLLGFLKPLKKKKYGNWLVAILSISVIWMYTLMTGMSPSVLRAAVMFSVMATSSAIDRDNNIYNSLGIAAFILLLYDPNLLFSVGFQLSFLALTGIVYLQPRIYSRLYVSNRFLNMVWSITAVSIAAQVSTVPLTVYYFNQFPTYFFLSNLVVIPGAMAIMILGISMLMIGGLWDGLGSVLGFVLDHLIQLMNFLVKGVEQIPGSLITWLYLDDLQLIAFYLSFVTLLLAIHHKSVMYAYSSGVLAFLFVGISHWNLWSQSSENELVIYDISATTAIDHITGRSASLHLTSYSDDIGEMLRFQVDPFRRARRLNPYQTDMAELARLNNSNIRVGQIGELRVMVLDSALSGHRISEPLETHVLIVNNRSVRNIDWLLTNFRFNMLIIGSQNTFSYSRWLRNELLDRNIEAHSLLLDGSWRRSLAKQN